MRIFKIALLSLTTLGLTACHLRPPEERPDGEKAGGASFLIESVSGKAHPGENHAEFSIPKSVVYNFSVCLKDLARNSALPGQEFSVDEVSLRKTTDSKGCLNWSEKIEFNYLARSTYVRLERTITARSLSRGWRKIELGINPWGHGEETSEVVDLGRQQVEPLLKDLAQVTQHLKGVDEKGTPNPRRLWLEDLRFTVSDERLTSEGFSITYQLAGVPQIILNKMSGQKILQPLTAGRFDARLQVIHQDISQGKEVRRVLTEKSLSAQTLKNNSLSLRFPVVYSHVPTSGQIHIGLVLTPVGAPAGLGTFEGVFPLGDHRTIKANAFLKVSPVTAAQENFSLQSYALQLPEQKLAPGLHTAATGLTPASTHAQRAKVEVDRLQFALIRRGQENAIDKEVVYRVRACLRSGVDQEGLRARRFLITKFRTQESDTVETVEAVTDNTACLAWYETVKFKYYDCQHFTKGYVTIANTDLGWKEKLEYVVNPWEYQGTFALDIRDVDPKENLRMFCDEGSRLKGQVDLDAYSYTTVSYNYEIDRELNLSVKKKLQFRLDPKVLMYSSLSSGLMDRQTLRDGPYLLRLLILRNRDYDSDNTYVTHAEKLVQVIGGRVASEVEIKTADLKALRNRNTLLVELAPVKRELVRAGEGGRLEALDAGRSLVSLIDNSSELNSPAFTGPIILSNDEGGRPLRLAEITALTPYLLNGRAEEKIEGSLLTKLLEQGLAQEAKRRTTQRESSGLETWAARQDLILLGRDARSEKILKGLGIDEKNYPVARMAQLRPGFWSELRDSATPASSSVLQNLDRGLAPELARKLCRVWGHELLADALGPANVAPFLYECLRAAATKPESFFRVERRLRVHELGSFDYLKGLRRGVSVGAGFSMTRTHTETTTTTASLTANAGLSTKFFEVLSLGISGSYGLSWSVADSQANANSVSVNEGIGLTILENHFRLNVTASENCSVLRLQPELFKTKPKKWVLWQPSDMKDLLRKDISEEAKIRALRQGIMICDGRVSKQPLSLLEKYYLVSQEMAESELQDAGDARNRHFFVGLRGESDLRRFLTFIKAQSPQSSPSNEYDFSDLGAAVESLFSETATAPAQILLPPKK